MNSENPQNAWARLVARFPFDLFLLVLPVALLLHFFFSGFGFEPGNTGQVLAGAKRVLAGQMPWSDFYTVIGPLTYYLHIPVLSFSNVFKVTRLIIWLELSLTVWLFTHLVCKSFSLVPFRVLRGLIATSALAVASNIMPMEPSHILDACCLSALGLVLVSGRSVVLKNLGLLLIGSATLCKPAFFVVSPVALCAFASWRNLLNWFSVLLPVLIGLLWLELSGVLPVAIKFMAVGDPLWIGVKWLWFRNLGSVFVGYLGIRILKKGKTSTFTERSALVTGFIVLTVIPVYLSWNSLTSGDIS
ncbi:MAG: hypothetical protein GX811_12385, partial [Lentisphaerae bacterium]|nr:hypothetical protein [Lentisphaerota bacterium]